MKSIKIAAALLATFISASVFAGPVYEYSIDTPPGSAGAGDIKNVTTSYDASNEIFSWAYTIGRDNAGNLSDGFWLVVTDGENPKGDMNEYAILYGDVSGNRVSAYEYSGLNNANSYITPGNLLDSFTGIISSSDDDKGTANLNDDTRTIGFSIDVSDINDGNEDTNEGIWEGTQFGEKIGIWFHPSSSSTFTYSSETGNLTSYGYNRQGYYDTGNQTTTTVPEPDLLLLLAIALLALGLHNKGVFPTLSSRIKLEGVNAAS